MEVLKPVWVAHGNEEGTVQGTAATKDAPGDADGGTLGRRAPYQAAQKDHLNLLQQVETGSSSTADLLTERVLTALEAVHRAVNDLQQHQHELGEKEKITPQSSLQLHPSLKRSSLNMAREELGGALWNLSAPDDDESEDEERTIDLEAKPGSTISCVVNSEINQQESDDFFDGQGLVAEEDNLMACADGAVYLARSLPCSPVPSPERSDPMIRITRTRSLPVESMRPPTPASVHHAPISSKRKERAAVLADANAAFLARAGGMSRMGATLSAPPSWEDGTHLYGRESCGHAHLLSRWQRWSE